MKSRGRLAFRPGKAAVLGLDPLEYRQLLSAVGSAEVERVQSESTSTADTSHTGGSSSSVVVSSEDSGAAASVQAEDPAPAATSGKVASLAETDGQASGQQTASTETSSANPAASVVDSSRSDPVESVANPGVLQQAGGSSTSGASAQSGGVDPTPWDEGGSARTAEAPALDQSGGGGALMIAGVATAASSPRGPVESQMSSGPAGPAAAPIQATSSPVADIVSGPAIETPLTIDNRADSTMLANVGAITLRTASAPVRVQVSQGTDILEGASGSLADAGRDESPESARAAASPRCSDLLTEFLPFDRARIEDAIDRFLAPLEGLGEELASWSPSMGLLPAAALVATTALATEVVRRRIGVGRTADEEGGEDLARFPGHPWAWGLGES